MLLFKTLFSIAVVVCSIMVCFFLVGLLDGSVSSFNIGIWFSILAGLIVIVGGSWYCNLKGKPRIANAMLLAIVIPALLFGLLLLVMIFSDAKWN